MEAVPIDVEKLAETQGILRFFHAKAFSVTWAMESRVGVPREIWVHICPIQGEEICFAERVPAEQVHTCQREPETHFWKGASRMAETK